MEWKEAVELAKMEITEDMIICIHRHVIRIIILH